MKNNEKLINQFKESIWNLWAQDGKNVWPIDLNSIIHLFIKEFFTEINENIENLEKRGLSDVEISKKFKTFSRIIRLTVPMLIGMKRLKLSINEQRAHVIRMLSFAKHLKHTDLLNVHGKNLILANKQIQKLIVSGISYSKKKESILIHSLCSILYAFCEIIFFKTHGFIKEFHGPYVYKGNEYVIRDYFDLNCSMLWEELSDFDINNVRIITAYKPLGIKIDIFSNLYINQRTGYIPNLSGYKIQVNGKGFNVSEIPNLINKIQNVMLKIGKRIERMNWKQLAGKYAELFWFAKCELNKPTFSIPKKVKENINNGHLNHSITSISPEKLYKMLKISL